MAQRSTITEHEDRAKIEYDLCRGVPIRHMAKEYGVSIDSLYRYKAQLPPQLKAAALASKLKAGADLDKLRIDESESILTNLAMQRARLLLVQDAALEVGDRREVAYISDVIARNVKLTGVYLGEFARLSVQTSVNILISTEYLELRSELIRALAPFPQARAAVAAALHAREAAAAEPKATPMIEATAEREAVNA
jgi:hypothetical protein